MIIGICGKSGSGKSTLAKILKTNHKNVVHLDIDKVGHNALEKKEAKEELIQTFGEEILNQKYIDRKKLGQKVFNSRHQMDNLTKITWKYMQLEIDEFLKNNENKIIILDWLLLPLSKYFEKCDIKILLDVPYEIRKQRAIKRDNITENEFDLREKATINYDKKLFDFVFDSADEEKIRKRVRIL